MLRGSGKPKPFQRKSITLSADTTGAKKVWKDIHPVQAQPGDILLGNGLIDSIEHRSETGIDGTVQYFAVFSLRNGTRVKFDAAKGAPLIRVFTKA